MRAHTIPLQKGEDSFVMVSEHPPIILRHYNMWFLDQHWFSFMDGAVFIIEREKPEPLPIEAKTKVAPNKLRAESLSGSLEKHHRHPFQYEKGVPQYPLPFPQFKRLSNSAFKRLTLAGYPTWDKNPETQSPYTTKITERPFDPATWCSENFDGFFHCNVHVISCEKEIDAVRARLTFT